MTPTLSPSLPFNRKGSPYKLQKNFWTGHLSHPFWMIFQIYHFLLKCKGSKDLNVSFKLSALAFQYHDICITESWLDDRVGNTQYLIGKFDTNVGASQAGLSNVFLVEAGQSVCLSLSSSSRASKGTILLACGGRISSSPFKKVEIPFLMEITIIFRSSLLFEKLGKVCQRLVVGNRFHLYTARNEGKTANLRIDWCGK